MQKNKIEIEQKINILNTYRHSKSIRQCLDIEHVIIDITKQTKRF